MRKELFDDEIFGVDVDNDSYDSIIRHKINAFRLQPSSIISSEIVKKLIHGEWDLREIKKYSANEQENLSRIENNKVVSLYNKNVREFLDMYNNSFQLTSKNIKKDVNKFIEDKNVNTNSLSDFLNIIILHKKYCNKSNDFYTGLIRNYVDQHLYITKNTIDKLLRESLEPIDDALIEVISKIHLPFEQKEQSLDVSNSVTLKKILGNYLNTVWDNSNNDAVKKRTLTQISEYSDVDFVTWFKEIRSDNRDWMIYQVYLLIKDNDEIYKNFVSAVKRLSSLDAAFKNIELC